MPVTKQESKFTIIHLHNRQGLPCGCVPGYVAYDITQVGIVIRRELPFEDAGRIRFSQIIDAGCVQGINCPSTSPQRAENIGSPSCVASNTYLYIRTKWRAIDIRPYYSGWLFFRPVNKVNTVNPSFYWSSL